MRVVEIGNLPEKEIVCEECHSTLAYTKPDIVSQVDEYMGELHDHTYVSCPVCGNKIILTIDCVSIKEE